MLKCHWKVIIHAGTNAAVIDESIILQELLQLKSPFSERYPECNVIITYPTLCTDNHAAEMLQNLHNKLKDLFPVIYYNNIDVDCLGRGELHLNEKGSGKLAVYFISYNRRH